MSTENPVKSVKEARAELDVISNRIAVALAKREGVLKSFSASRSLPRKTEQEQEAEEIALFRPEPPNLGLGAPIPSQFLVSEAERNNKTLRERFFPKKTLKDSKAREEEKVNRTLKKPVEESSDEEEGRSGLGRAKKQRTSVTSVSKEPKVEVKPSVESKSTGIEEQDKDVKPSPNVTTPEKQLNSISRVNQASPESASSMTLSNGSTDGPSHQNISSTSSKLLGGTAGHKSAEEIRRQKQLKKQRKRERQRLKQKKDKASSSN
ncbi:hypothetical protein F5884DRAFT_764086 [Xylogone sp. PMI_703]|nr:hypothetical protein F5884DRAFT_764086 [Xylogone sp. PMI_703]